MQNNRLRSQSVGYGAHGALLCTKSCTFANRGKHRRASKSFLPPVASAASISKLTIRSSHLLSVLYPALLVDNLCTVRLYA